MPRYYITLAVLAVVFHQSSYGFILGKHFREVDPVNCTSDQVTVSSCYPQGCSLSPCNELFEHPRNLWTSWEPDSSSESNSTITIIRSRKTKIVWISFSVATCELIDVTSIINYVTFSHNSYKHPLYKTNATTYFAQYVVSVPPSENVTMTLHTTGNKCYYIYAMNLYTLNEFVTRNWITLKDIDSINCSDSNNDNCTTLFDNNFIEPQIINNFVNVTFTNVKTLYYTKLHVIVYPCVNQTFNITAYYDHGIQYFIVKPEYMGSDDSGFLDVIRLPTQATTKHVNFHFDCGGLKTTIVEMEICGIDYTPPQTQPRPPPSTITDSSKSPLMTTTTSLSTSTELPIPTYSSTSFTDDNPIIDTTTVRTSSPMGTTTSSTITPGTTTTSTSTSTTKDTTTTSTSTSTTKDTTVEITMKQTGAGQTDSSTTDPISVQPSSQTQSIPNTSQSPTGTTEVNTLTYITSSQRVLPSTSTATVTTNKVTKATSPSFSTASATTNKVTTTSTSSSTALVTTNKSSTSATLPSSSTALSTTNKSSTSATSPSSSTASAMTTTNELTSSDSSSVHSRSRSVRDTTTFINTSPDTSWTVTSELPDVETISDLTVTKDRRTTHPTRHRTTKQTTTRFETSPGATTTSTAADKTSLPAKYTLTTKSTATSNDKLTTLLTTSTAGTTSQLSSTTASTYTSTILSTITQLPSTTTEHLSKLETTIVTAATRTSTTTAAETSTQSTTTDFQTVETQPPKPPTTSDTRKGIYECVFKTSSETFMDAYKNKSSDEFYKKSTQYYGYLIEAYMAVNTSGVNTAFISILIENFYKGSIGTTYTLNLADSIPVATDNSVRNSIVNSITDTFAKNNITVDPNSFVFTDKSPTTDPPKTDTETVLLAGILGSVVTLLVIALAIAAVVIRTCIKSQRHRNRDENQVDDDRYHRRSEVNNNFVFQFPNNYSSGHNYPSFMSSSFRGRGPPPPYERRTSSEAMFEFPTPMSHFLSNDQNRDDSSSLSGRNARTRMQRRKKDQRQRRDSDPFDTSSLGGYIPTRTDVPPLRPSRNIYDQSVQDQGSRQTHEVSRQYRRQIPIDSSPIARTINSHGNTSNELHRDSNSVLHRNVPNDLHRDLTRMLHRNTTSDHDLHNDSNSGLHRNVSSNLHRNINDGPDNNWILSSEAVPPRSRDDNSNRDYGPYSYPPGHQQQQPSDRTELSDLFTNPISNYDTIDHHTSSNKNNNALNDIGIDEFEVMFRGADGQIHRRNVHSEQGRLRLHRTMSHESEQSHSRVNGNSNEGYDDDALTPYYMAEEQQQEQTGILSRLSKSLSTRTKLREGERIHRRPPSYMQKAPQLGKKQSNA